MLSYRDHLVKIGIGRDQAVSYKAFSSRPASLRAAIRSMNAPASGDWQQVNDLFRDEFWTDEVQGVAWNGSRWVFCANARQSKPDSEDKALYVFAAGNGFRDNGWDTRLKFIDVPHPIASTESDCHWGQLTYYEGEIYISHFWEEGPLKGVVSAVVVQSQGATLAPARWLELTSPVSEGRAEFQTINPWDGLLYTYLNGVFYMHDPVSGEPTGGTLELDVVIQGVQGACFSPNGHVYVASNEYYQGDERYQSIYYFSALNGHHFGTIAVPAEEGMTFHELEGICFAPVAFDGVQQAQIHAVLLENPDVALDNVYLKSFAAAQPEWV